MGEIRGNLQKNLRYYLSLKDINQKELAKQLNVSPSAVTNWIKGKNSPDIEVVAQLCDILEISITDLLGTNDEIDNNFSSTETKELILELKNNLINRINNAEFNAGQLKMLTKIVDAVEKEYTTG